MKPRATYRVQLSSEFTFQQAADLCDYFQALGISHLYCSPVLQATPGSAHGYDVVDPTHISDDLGGAASLRHLLDAAAERGMGVVVDIVPNHMSTAGRANPWWWDLLAHGPSSRYADYFDIDWRPAGSTLKDKVLLAVLGDRYGRELEAHALTLTTEGDETVVRYHDQEFPVAPGSLDGAHRERVAADIDELDRLLERQHYRLAYWRSAQDELNYRRFFTVDQLIGLRIERPQVFADSHRVILDLVADGRVDGLRVDHVDGLRDPTGYLTRLRRAAPDAYIAVEKIVATDEQLPSAFPVEGTTGYEFIAAVDGVFVDAGNEPAMTALYHAFTGETQPYAEVTRASKQHIIATELATDLVRLSGLMHDICEADRRHRDRTQREVHEALGELAVAMRVYRTYVTPDAPPTEQDRAAVRHAVEESTRRRPDIDPELIAFIGDVVLLDRRGDSEIELSARFQQFTPAVMAKGLEDTAFYRYNRLVSLNEVGGNPGTFGRTVEQFHELCARNAATHPHTMLTRTTHDTKRSADVRARINLLSEMPAEWEAAVRRWSELNDRHRPHGYPDRNIEYLIYQTLVGAWPIDKERLTEYLNKAAREAKLHTSWMSPVAAYEDALAAFVEAILSDGEFTADFESFLGRTQIVAFGRTASLAQTALLLTCPGVPDIYQGSELWNITLVDPDNRRAVDYTRRRGLLDEVANMAAEEALARSDEGSPKLWLIARLLRAKADHPEVFAAMGYSPLEATGAKARHALGFVRGPLLVLVPRLPAGLGGDWGDTQLVLPKGRWTNVLTGATESGGRSSVAAILERFPVAVMTSAG
ncbi:MAG TPA: malto-oligosyltrehalose synthase [Candidatus Dormibacteraeota bacterium]|nr:malto-oligosyltrehalose synthase [Candidatus Dormibacteraeota bacterium]